MSDMRKEVREAIAAGNDALSSLYQARDLLQSARNWGIWDILGGGFLSTMIKHHKLDQANACMSEAERKLAVFREELKDVELPQMQLSIDGFLSFADFFFDGVLEDYLVQRKINQARDKVERAITYVEALVRELENYD